MSEMIRRVAQAIYEGSPRNKPYEHLSAFKRAVYQAEARSAIEAMRVPTEMMLDASYRWDEKIAATETHPHARGTWHAMIDAALASEPKP